MNLNQVLETRKTLLLDQFFVENGCDLSSGLEPIIKVMNNVLTELIPAGRIGRVQIIYSDKLYSTEGFVSLEKVKKDGQMLREEDYPEFLEALSLEPLTVGKKVVLENGAFYTLGINISNKMATLTVGDAETLTLHNCFITEDQSLEDSLRDFISQHIS